MSYVNDVFISYRRETHAWTPWARDIFKPALSSLLQRELGKAPKIFIDEQVPVGVDYVDSLANALAASKIMVALLSKDYFSSDWCIHELDLMMGRAGHNDLIIPIVVHDGEAIPEAVNRLQHADFKKYSNPALSTAGLLHAQFWDELAKLAPRIRDAIENAPAFESRWIKLFKRRFTDIFNAPKARKTPRPKQFVVKKSLPPRVPPRLNI